MAIKQQIHQGAIRKYVTCIMAFFIPFYSPILFFLYPILFFYSVLFANFTVSTPLCHLLKLRNIKKITFYLVAKKRLKSRDLSGHKRWKAVVKVSNPKFQTLRTKEPRRVKRFHCYKNYLVALLINEIIFIFW